jgi:translation elongation factor EF-4
MKNVFSRLYSRTIQKKNILLIRQRKDEKKKIKYIESQYIPFNLL